MYELVGSIVSREAPPDWVQIVVAAELEDDTGEALYDYRDVNGDLKWFSPPTAEQYKIYLALQELREMMRAAGQPWRKARFILEKSGQFRTEFEYE